MCKNFSYQKRIFDNSFSKAVTQCPLFPQDNLWITFTVIQGDSINAIYEIQFTRKHYKHQSQEVQLPSEICTGSFERIIFH